MTIRTRISSFYRLAGLAVLGLVLAGCQESDFPKAFKPVPAELVAKMDKLGMNETGQIMLRVYKESSELEVWKEQRDGRFALLDTFNICKWSGALGPKVKEGDRQAPEGFYAVTPAQMNPNSNYYLSFNIGYPNAYDRALGRTGSNLMVHGACSSAGCYSMTDESAGILFALARDSFRGGQRDFQIQAYPFRMTAENMAKHHDDPNMPFWRMLKVGADHFEVTRKPPKVDVCNKNYVFDADAGTATFNASAACPPYQVPQWIASAVDAKTSADDAKMTELAASFDAEKKKAAEAQAVADARAAAKAKEDADKAVAEANALAEPAPAKPSLLARVLKRGEKEPPATAPQAMAPQATVTATAASPEPLGTATGAPVPRDKPGAKPGAKAAGGNASARTEANGAEAAPATAATAAVAPAPKPTVGQFLKKKFLWWEDDNAPPAAAPAQPAQAANPG